ncbi:RNA-directed DNA polymerase [bacterium]|nr:RNA-directed DNA polymerase [bacterium]
MSKIKLKPATKCLSEEYVLVPAWKKAHDYIRRHNWYSDVLELDLTNADLESVIRDIANEIKSQSPLAPIPLRLVLAPKTQAWEIRNEQWRPVEGTSSVERKLRPLAHVSVRDQILGTAFMILMADLAETRQGDPRMPAAKAREMGMVSYGHRLFCDRDSNELRFRWGNAGVYRQYFQDYQNFIARPEQTVRQNFETIDTNWAIVSADLSQFYDRVRPEILHASVRRLLGKQAEKRFVQCFESLFNWTWHGGESKEALKYASRAKPNSIPDFDRVALPQGLVSSGFFSNVVLLDFDDSIVKKFDEWNSDGEWQLLDYCRYVDDMRFVVRLEENFGRLKQPELEARLIESFSKLLSDELNHHATGLVVNSEKCGVVLGRNAAAGSVRVSSSMRRVDHNASGVMDLFVGEETLELIETLLYSSETNALGLGGRFQDSVLSAKPDVREETAARFAANRFRSAFRRLRPMSETSEEQEANIEQKGDEDSLEWNAGRFRLSSTLTRKTLDEKVKHFGSRLVERWIRDPSNMRLLRVALDLRPDVRTLEVVLELLNEYLGVKTKRKAPRRVAWYCAAELLKAGATETGLVDDNDKLPDGIDPRGYQTKLAELARHVLSRKNVFPWYLVQQAYLFLACFGEYLDLRFTRRSNPALRHYVLLHKALKGDYRDLVSSDVPKFALLQAGLLDTEAAAEAFLKRWKKEGAKRKSRWLVRIVTEQRQLAIAVWNKMSVTQKAEWRKLFEGYGVLDGNSFPSELKAADSDRKYSLLDVSRSPANPFQQEYLAIRFALKLIPWLTQESVVVTPDRVLIRSRDWLALRSDHFPVNDRAFEIELDATSLGDSRFQLPDWVGRQEYWKYQLGMLLRVLLTGNPDYTLDSRANNSRSHIAYRPYRSSWLRRRYGMFNGRNAFGPPSIPISSWFGSLLNKLLHWPGFPEIDFELRLPAGFKEKHLIELLQNRAENLESTYGRASRMSLLPVTVPKALGFARARDAGERKLAMRRMRVGVAQTVIPRHDDFANDPQLLIDSYRRRHRRHTASVLAGIQRMLEVRTTHQDSAIGIELLVLPELSIHPLDVQTLLVPFVMQNRCIVCAGLVFQPLEDGDDRLVNMAAWLIPVRRPTGGIEVQIVHQGKQHMTGPEQDLGISPFRPAQWILELVDPNELSRRLWSMTSAVCYDATDLSLAADLRNQTDLFIVPALNVDVGTFDNLAAALHYHMFQHVIVANSGEFGGSSAHAPFADKTKRTIFHTHGNEQVTVSIFEINFDLYQNEDNKLKYPPANHSRRRTTPGPTP